MCSIVRSFAECGASIRALERFVHATYQGAGAASQTRVALARCTATVLDSVQKRLASEAGAVRSILHLHSLFSDPALILDAFVILTEATAGAKDDCELLSKLFDAVQQQQHRSGWLKPLLVETLARVSKPWLEFVEQWIGLDEGPGGLGIAEMIQKKGFIAMDETTEMDETGKERVVTSFVSMSTCHLCLSADLWPDLQQIPGSFVPQRGDRRDRF